MSFGTRMSPSGILFIVCNYIFALSISASPDQFYSLNTSALDALWHRAAVMALLRAKAKALVIEHDLREEEKFLFKQCSVDARTVVEMAKCVRNLMRERDRIVEGKEEEKKKQKMGRSRSKKELEEPERPRPIPGSTLEGLLGLLQDTFGNVWENGEGGAGWQLKEEQEAEEEHIVETDREEGRRDELQIKLEKKTLHFTHQKLRHFGEIKMGRRWKRANNQFVHLDNLHELQRFLEMRRYCEDYLGRVAERNAEFLRSHLPYPVQVKVDSDEGPKGINARMNDIVSIFTEFLNKGMNGQSWRRLSIMSPQLFPVMASTKPDSMTRLLLSPRLFSLSPNDGLLALPDLLGASARGMNGRKERWMNGLLAISGAGKAIGTALEELKEERKRLEEKIFPLVVEMEKRDARWKHLLDPEQRRDVAEKGFAFLSADQLRHVYGADQTFDADSAGLSAKQRRQRMEMAILALAELDDDGHGQQHQRRFKRAASLDGFGAENSSKIWEGGNGTWKSNEMKQKEGDNGSEKTQEKEENREKENPLRILAPYAFANFMADGVALEATILSPNAFISELLSPAALFAQVLSPRAFIAAILSPEALYSRVLSPSAFNAEVLSPRALSPFVLSPEAMATEILSPRVLEPRVLSPEFGLIKVLSPEFLSPRILSPEQLAIIVLSPAILSPHVLSHEKLTIEVISPHILSGSGEGEEEEEKEHGQEHHHHGHQHIGVGHESGDGHGMGHGEEGHQHIGHGQGHESGNGHGIEHGEELIHLGNQNLGHGHESGDGYRMGHGQEELQHIGHGLRDGHGVEEHNHHSGEDNGNVNKHRFEIIQSDGEEAIVDDGHVDEHGSGRGGNRNGV